jgi:23S rRNA U2552 (ribose-2'-O)-methylase RlmE/FtsJ
MDPTIALCSGESVPPGFPENPDNALIWLITKPADSNIGILPTQKKDIKFAEKSRYNEIKPQYGSISNWLDLRTRQNEIRDIERISKEVNPYENVGRYCGIHWIGRAGLKLANLDAIFHLSKSDDTFTEPVDIRPFSFVDLAGGPGAFTQYLQYRRPRSQGWGMSLTTEIKGCAWELNLIDNTRFTVLKGADETGNLITNYYWAIDAIKKDNPNGVDLVVADGFIKDDVSSTFEDYKNEEVTNMNLILCELGIGLNTVKENCDMVCKVTDTLRPTTAEALYALSLAFEKVCLFKPMTSRPANAEKYIICKRRRKNIDFAARIFAAYYEQISNGYIAQPVLPSLPSEFEDKLIQSNNIFLNEQLEILRQIEDRYNGKRVRVRNLNLPRAIQVWHLPMKGDKYFIPPTRANNLVCN